MLHVLFKRPVVVLPVMVLSLTPLNELLMTSPETTARSGSLESPMRSHSDSHYLRPRHASCRCCNYYSFTSCSLTYDYWKELITRAVPVRFYANKSLHLAKDACSVAPVARMLERCIVFKFSVVYCWFQTMTNVQLMASFIRFWTLSESML